MTDDNKDEENSEGKVDQSCPDSTDGQHSWNHCFTQDEKKDKERHTLRTLWVCEKCFDYMKSVGEKKYYNERAYLVK